MGPSAAEPTLGSEACAKTPEPDYGVRRSSVKAGFAGWRRPPHTGAGPVCGKGPAPVPPGPHFPPCAPSFSSRPLRSVWPFSQSPSLQTLCHRPSLLCGFTPDLELTPLSPSGRGSLVHQRTRPCGPGRHPPRRRPLRRTDAEQRRRDQTRGALRAERASEPTRPGLEAPACERGAGEPVFGSVKKKMRGAREEWRAAQGQGSAPRRHLSTHSVTVHGVSPSLSLPASLPFLPPKRGRQRPTPPCWPPGPPRLPTSGHAPEAKAGASSEATRPPRTDGSEAPAPAGSSSQLPGFPAPQRGPRLPSSPSRRTEISGAATFRLGDAHGSERRGPGKLWLLRLPGRFPLLFLSRGICSPLIRSGFLKPLQLVA